MKVFLFAGIAGTTKTEALLSLRKEILRNHPDAVYRGLAQTPDHQAAKTYVNQYCVEQDIKDNEGIGTLLEADQAGIKSRWGQSFGKCLDAIRREGPDIALVDMHLTFLRQSRFLSPLNWELEVQGIRGTESRDPIQLLRELQPSAVVTLIDDIQWTWQNIEKGSYLRLRELLMWRDIEISHADLLAKLVTIPPVPYSNLTYSRSLVVAANHPASMLYRLLLEGNRLRIYACIPISSTRKSEADRSNVDSFVRELNERFTVFNPLTIDERPMTLLLGSGRKKVTLKTGNRGRWPFTPGDTLCPQSKRSYDIKGLRVSEIQEISSASTAGTKPDIDRHITHRDYRLIDQSDVLAVYRLTYKSKNPHSGMDKEVTYAKAHLKKVYHVQDPDEDGMNLGALSPEKNLLFQGRDSETIPRLVTALLEEQTRRERRG